MTECPNCLTPWKCNGPHMTDDIPLPTEEIAAYWDIAYSEGGRNARYDTSDGSAQSALQDLQEAIRAYGDARAAAERERCVFDAEQAYIDGRGAKGVIDAIRAGS